MNRQRPVARPAHHGGSITPEITRDCLPSIESRVGRGIGHRSRVFHASTSDRDLRDDRGSGCFQRKRGQSRTIQCPDPIICNRMQQFATSPSRRGRCRFWASPAPIGSGEQVNALGGNAEAKRPPGRDFDALQTRAKFVGWRKPLTTRCLRPSLCDPGVRRAPGTFFPIAKSSGGGLRLPFPGPTRGRMRVADRRRWDGGVLVKLVGTTGFEPATPTPPV